LRTELVLHIAIAQRPSSWFPLRAIHRPTGNSES
jgi:hypothetical protein